MVRNRSDSIEEKSEVQTELHLQIKLTEADLSHVIENYFLKTVSRIN